MVLLWIQLNRSERKTLGKKKLKWKISTFALDWLKTQVSFQSGKRTYTCAVPKSHIYNVETFKKRYFNWHLYMYVKRLVRGQAYESKF